MRLIDADKLKEAINSCLNTGKETFSPEIIYEAVDEQPTAFDVDKVVESLTNRFRIVSNDEDLEWNRAMDCAVKIVKGGGIE